MKKYMIIALTIVFSLYGCKEDQKEAEQTTTNTVEEKKVEETVYKRLPPNYVSAILTQADALEGTFYESGKSVSLWDDNVKNVLSMMTEEAPTTLDAKLVGHIMYLKEGQNLAYVEIFMSPKNNFVKYKVNNEIYYNRLNAQGVQFMNQMATAIPLVTE